MCSLNRTRRALSFSDEPRTALCRKPTKGSMQCCRCPKSTLSCPWLRSTKLCGLLGTRHDRRSHLSRRGARTSVTHSCESGAERPRDLQYRCECAKVSAFPRSLRPIRARKSLPLSVWRMEDGPRVTLTKGQARTRRLHFSRARFTVPFCAPRFLLAW